MSNESIAEMQAFTRDIIAKLRKANVDPKALAALERMSQLAEANPMALSEDCPGFDEADAELEDFIFEGLARMTASDPNAPRA